MKINIQADKVSIRGPKVDGSYVVSFEFGEFQRKKIAELLADLRPDEIVELTVAQDDNPL